MLRYLSIPCLLFLVGDALATSNSENAVEKKDPPNEWGTYYSLPAELPEMTTLFLEVYSDYVDKAPLDFKCRDNDADFSRWYVSSENPDHVLLSYYCRTKAVRGYEHLKVSKSLKNVLQYGSSLKTFGIMDAKDYEDKLPESEGKELRDALLFDVTDTIALQVSDTEDQGEMCPDPGTDTLFNFRFKYENGLYYYRFSISCNVTYTPGYPTHMADIEIVQDKDFKVLNEGKPVLISMEQPRRNTWYIREKEEEEARKEEEALKGEEALKQNDSGARITASIVTIMLTPMFQLLF